MITSTEFFSIRNCIYFNRNISENYSFYFQFEIICMLQQSNVYHTFVRIYCQYFSQHEIRSINNIYKYYDEPNDSVLLRCSIRYGFSTQRWLLFYAEISMIIVYLFIFFGLFIYWIIWQNVCIVSFGRYKISKCLRWRQTFSSKLSFG